MTQEALKKMYQLLLTEPHAPTVCAQLEVIAREALAQTQEPDEIASILACRDMLDAQPVSEVDRVIWPERTEQEPVAWPCLIDSADFSKNTITLVMQCDDYKVSAGTHWLSTTPPQRTWVGLTDEEICEIEEEELPWREFLIAFAKAVEAKLKELNT